MTRHPLLENLFRKLDCKLELKRSQNEERKIKFKYAIYLILSEPSGKFSSHEKLNNCICGVIKGLCTLYSVSGGCAVLYTLLYTHKGPGVLKTPHLSDQ